MKSRKTPDLKASAGATETIYRMLDSHMCLPTPILKHNISLNNDSTRNCVTTIVHDAAVSLELDTLLAKQKLDLASFHIFLCSRSVIWKGHIWLHFSVCFINTQKTKPDYFFMQRIIISSDNFESEQVQERLVCLCVSMHVYEYILSSTFTKLLVLKKTALS